LFPPPVIEVPFSPATCGGVIFFFVSPLHCKWFLVVLCCYAPLATDNSPKAILCFLTGLNSYSLLLTSYSLLLTPYFLLLASYSLLLTPCFLLLTSYSLLLTPCFLLILIEDPPMAESFVMVGVDHAPNTFPLRYATVC